MRFIEVKEIPEKNQSKVQYHVLYEELEEFMNMNVKQVRVIVGEHEYSSYLIARESLAKAVRYHGLPIKIITRKNDLYLMRTDI